jgi:hypothetical protein
MKQPLPSSPGLTGRPGIPERLVRIADALEYWIPAFAGMTAGAQRGFVLLPSPLRGGVGGGGLQARHLWLPPTPTLPRKGGGSRRRLC